MRLVHGIGINDGTYPSAINKRTVKEYVLWQHMLFRCIPQGWNNFPTYTGVTCSEKFKNYSFFYEWCQSQVGFGNKESNGRFWQLDKDLLIKGNKNYSEDTCVFVPQRINKLLLGSNATRGNHPIGVCFDKTRGKYMARGSKGGGKQKNLGYYDTPQEAFKVYKEFKEWVIKDAIEHYKAQIDERVYNTLMDYKVENDIEEVK